MEALHKMQGLFHSYIKNSTTFLFNNRYRPVSPGS
jgi:hypothetical protein